MGFFCTCEHEHNYVEQVVETLEKIKDVMERWFTPENIGYLGAYA
jgi:hypothetical protein